MPAENKGRHGHLPETISPGYPSENPGEENRQKNNEAKAVLRLAQLPGRTNRRRPKYQQ